MYRKTIGTDNAVKLPLKQDAWLLFRFGHHEIIRLDLAPGEAIENHAGKERFWHNTGKDTLELLVIKTDDKG